MGEALLSLQRWPRAQGLCLPPSFSLRSLHMDPEEVCVALPSWLLLCFPSTSVSMPAPSCLSGPLSLL